MQNSNSTVCNVQTEDADAEENGKDDEKEIMIRIITEIYMRTDYSSTHCRGNSPSPKSYVVGFSKHGRQTPNSMFDVNECTLIQWSIQTRKSYMALWG